MKTFLVVTLFLILMFDTIGVIKLRDIAIATDTHLNLLAQKVMSLEYRVDVLTEVNLK